MNLRIGERDSSPLSQVRSSGAPGRSRSAVSEPGGQGDRARAEDGVVIRLSADAQKILGRREGEGEDQDRLLARRRDRDSEGDRAVELAATPGRAGSRAAAVVLPAGVSEGSAETPGDQPGGDPTAEAAGDRAGAGKAGRDEPAVAGQAKKLTPEDKQVVSQLSARDTAVRAHEAAHQAAASGLGGAASFTYETGPDGRSYAVGGEVPVSLRPGRTPEETIANAQTVRSAALAPADPSAQDLAVAAQAAQMEAEARQQMTRDQAEVAQPGQQPSGQTGQRAGAAGARGSDGRGEKAGATAAGEPRGDRKAEGGEQAPARDVEQDQVMIFSTLRAERGAVVDGGGHRHLASGGACGICSRAAARYA